jgi:hypothetical protein
MLDTLSIYVITLHGDRIAYFPIAGLTVGNFRDGQPHLLPLPFLRASGQSPDNTRTSAASFFCRALGRPNDKRRETHHWLSRTDWPGMGFAALNPSYRLEFMAKV